MQSVPNNLKPYDYEILIIGAGISGIGAGIMLQKSGFNSFLLLEKEEQLGGTWRDNHYPGVAVDITSFSYSFSFEPNPNWSRFYAPGEEIQRYIHHCVEKYGIKQKIRYRSQVKHTRFNTDTHTWTTHLSDGTELTSRYVISATGILSQPIFPKITGLETFKGKMMHTALWDNSYDLKNKKVAIIGTGASAVQVVPSIAPVVQQLEVYQRTPIWVLPKLDRPIRAEERELFQKYPIVQHWRRLKSDIFLQLASFAVVNYKKFPYLIKKHEQICLDYLQKAVKDPELRKKLTPHYGLGCKRPALSNDYWQSFNRDNVSLITEAIDCITEQGIQTKDGKHQDLDLIILSTGFKVLEPGNAPSFEVFGLNNIELGRYWDQHQYQAFKGIAMPQFPNLFFTSGPYSGGFNWFTMLENHLKYIIRCLQRAKNKNATYIEVKKDAHDKYFQTMLQEAKDAIFTEASCYKSNSYYIDKHGQASLAYPRTPGWRWLSVRLSSLNDFYFKEKEFA